MNLIILMVNFGKGMGLKQKASALVLLDRDGTLCRNMRGGVLKYSDFKLVPHLRKSLARINSAQLRIGVVTNQPYIGERLLSKRTLERMDRILATEARKAGIRNFTIKYCPHAHGSDCDCRKPKPGLIRQAVREFGISPYSLRFYIVGDNLRDIRTLENYYDEVLRPRGVPRRAIKTIYLVWKYGEQRKPGPLKTSDGRRIKPDLIVHSLDGALEYIARKESAA